MNLGDSFPSITLPALQGGEISLASLKGKNVLIIFPRGRVADHWCQICHYQYAELADLEMTQQIRKKYNLEILFILPYDKATVQHWVDIFPEQMAVIESWKNPGAEELKNPRVKAWMEAAKKLLPKTFVMSKENIPVPFPILIDAERKVSEGLQLFALDWDNSYVEQNHRHRLPPGRRGQRALQVFQPEHRGPPQRRLPAQVHRTHAVVSGMQFAIN